MSYVMPSSGLKESLWAQFTGWSRESVGRAYYGSAMMGHYTHAEILDDPFLQKLQVLGEGSQGTDPYWMDTSIYRVHPFLRTWEKALGYKPDVKKAKEK